jgi:hypothetical protein
VIDRYFKYSESGPRGPHLHLEVPTVCLLAHREPFERIAPDRAKRTHIGIADAVQSEQSETGEPSGEDLRQVHAAWLANAAQT